MTGPDADPAPQADDTAAAEAVAARERQSHVRHELRAPLAVIYPLISLLRDGRAGELTDQQREYLEVLDRNVVRLETLIAGVTAGGWADCSAAPPQPGEVVLADVAREVVGLRRAEGNEDPPILIDCGTSPLPRAWADRDDVRQIVAYLVGNAAAYASGKGSIVIRAHSVDENATSVIEVEDSGPGIPSEELRRVFEFGFRGEVARERKVPGLGAGLWVCRELASRNGGALVLDSVPGVGTTARLTLPAVGPSPA